MLSQFSADYFARSPVIVFPIVALAIFMVVFIAVTVRALRSNKDEVDHLAALPLSDSEVDSHG